VVDLGAPQIEQKGLSRSLKLAPADPGGEERHRFLRSPLILQPSEHKGLETDATARVVGMLVNTILIRR